MDAAGECFYAPTTKLRDVRVVIFCATGYIERYVVFEFVRQGYQGVAFSRERSVVKSINSAQDVSNDFKGATVVLGDVTNAGDVARAFEFGDEQGTSTKPVSTVMVSRLASRAGGIADSNKIDSEATWSTLQQGRKAGASLFILLSAVCVQKPLMDFKRAKAQVRSRATTICPARRRLQHCIRDVRGRRSLQVQRDIRPTRPQLASVLLDRVTALVQSSLKETSYMVTEAQYLLDSDATPSFSRKVANQTESKVLSPSHEKHLTETNLEALVPQVAEWYAQQVEAIVFLPTISVATVSKSFTAFGALRADRDVRAISAYFSNKSRRSTVREVFGRLWQLAMLVNLERPAEIYDVLGPNAGGMTWRLTASEVKKALSLRSDFNKDAIKSLKL
ncbi:NAD(P)-binding protein [Gracilaria domingensis]|nr:NAD(P)-binding protein [Gracilaria domingensis]